MSLKNPVTQPVIDPGTVRLVAQRFNHHAILRHNWGRNTEQNNNINASNESFESLASFQNYGNP
jgi:hypothetical protein